MIGDTKDGWKHEKLIINKIYSPKHLGKDWYWLMHWYDLAIKRSTINYLQNTYNLQAIWAANEFKLRRCANAASFLIISW